MIDTIPDLPEDDEGRLATRIERSGFFDSEFYLRKYPDVRGYTEGPLIHFCRHGIFEKRDPGPYFDTRVLTDRFPSVEPRPFINALDMGYLDDSENWLARDDFSFQYLLSRSGLFIPEWYLEKNPDVAKSGMDPGKHLFEHGMWEGRDPGPDFDSEFYADLFPSFRLSKLSPLEHFLRLGSAMGFACSGDARYLLWSKRFQDLNGEDASRISADPALPGLPPVYVLALGDSARMRETNVGLTAQLGVSPKLIPLAENASREELNGALENVPDDSILILIMGEVRLREHMAYVFANVMFHFKFEAAYCDHHNSPAGMAAFPTFKPEMSPEFMRRSPYAGPVIAVKAGACDRSHLIETLVVAGRTRSSSDWAEVLLALPPRKVGRIPFILYDRPDHSASDQNGRPIYEPHQASCRLDPGDDKCDGGAGKALPVVDIIIPTRDRRDLLEACVDSITSQTRYPRERVKIIIVDNGSVEPDSVLYLREVSRRSNCVIVSSPGPFNFAEICNAGAAAARGDVLVFLNNDTLVRMPEWLDRFVSVVNRCDEIGVVGCQLVYHDETIQHGGVVLGVQGLAAHRLVGLSVEEASRIAVTRETVAVTGASLAVRRDLFEKLGGFDVTLGVGFNDTDFCIRAHKAGYRNICIAEPLLYHHESKTRGFDDTPAKRARAFREAIYVRGKYSGLFRDDPTYNPNLSLRRIGELSLSPRVVRPWRRSTPGHRRVLLLSTAHKPGQGVAQVVALQAAFLKGQGWEVIIGGPTSSRDRDYPGCHRVALWAPGEAAAFAVEEGIDCVVAHTPPFFSISRLLGRRPLFYIFDHGEPPASLFADRAAREEVDWEKRFCAPLARRTFVISQAIYDQQFQKDAVVVRNGNSHLATWSGHWAARRGELRRKWGVEGKFTTLTVCRFGEEERRYKGIDLLAEVIAEMPFQFPGFQGRMAHILAGAGGPDDVARMEALGLKTFANLSDEEMAELYAASDLYVSLSQWEGYNLGIGQALAMGLPVVASDIPAHREFGIETADSIPRLCEMVRRAFESRDEAGLCRAARIDDWNAPLSLMADVLEQDRVEENAGPWY